MKSRFRVEASFPLKSRSIVVFVGSLLDGTVRAGMVFKFRMDSDASGTRMVDAVEFIAVDGGERIGLCVKYQDHADMDLLLSLKVAGEVLHIEG